MFRFQFWENLFLDNNDISWSVYFSIYLNIINHINHKQRTLVYIIPCFNVSSPKSTGFPPPSYTSLSHELILDHFTRIPRQFFYCRRSQLLKPNFFFKKRFSLRTSYTFIPESFSFIVFVLEVKVINNI